MRSNAPTPVECKLVKTRYTRRNRREEDQTRGGLQLQAQEQGAQMVKMMDNKK